MATPKGTENIFTNCSQRSATGGIFYSVEKADVVLLFRTVAASRKLMCELQPSDSDFFFSIFFFLDENPKNCFSYSGAVIDRPKLFES